ncbi:hypothetical protein [Amycolatopsis solani]|uniref:hypothetical protein n=1 Tax=Amycolatopsis solani TaxID=3028615 RepID=UPI0025B209F1|nr:hypothetical protein [Amycolatopsis sp. MEP2-6]
MSVERGGPFACPSDFFASAEISANIIDGVLASPDADAIAGFEAINEIDQLDSYQLLGAVQWFTLLARQFDVPILVSAAEPWNSILLAAAAGQPVAACHFHGWPLGGARDVTQAIERLARSARVSTIWTEVSNDSQAPPQDRYQCDRLTLTCQVFSEHSHRPAYPWWWLEANALSRVTRMPQPPDVTQLSSTFRRNFWRPAAWARLARCVLLLWAPPVAALYFKIARAMIRRRLPPGDR